MENQDHPLRLYDSLKREVRQFVPQDAKNVTMYNCGPTVYSYAHIGNARAAVVADVLFRVLRHIYGDNHVRYARNLTDVDDRIIASAREQGVPISDITEKFTKIYQDDLAALNCLPPTVEPKATDAIGEMEDIIVSLLDKDIAYISGDQVLFDVSKDKGYGRLITKARLDGANAGQRVAVAEYKRNPGDFLLWKHVEGEAPEFAFDAPKIQSFADQNWRKFFNAPRQLSPGRPGWHIECSAMIREELGETIDIHCGGIDLKFPHHENEIAQSQCANGKQLARYWVHNEFLNMGKDKMSKSLGNVVLVHDLLKDWDGEVIRLALLKAHYRNELVWSEDLLRESKAQLDGWYRLQRAFSPSSNSVYEEENAHDLLDDLDTAEFFKNISSLVQDANIQYSASLSLANRSPVSGTENLQHGYSLASVVYADKAIQRLQLIGLLQHDPEDWFRGNASADDSAEFNALAAARHAARQAKDWAEADRIRDEGTARGIIFEDSADGTTWRKA